METGPRLKVSSDRLVKLGIEPATPGLQGKRFIHYTTDYIINLIIADVQNVCLISIAPVRVTSDKANCFPK